MRVLAWWVVLCAVSLFFTPSALAQDKVPRLTVEIDAGLRARLTLVDGGKLDRCVPASEPDLWKAANRETDLWKDFAYTFDGTPARGTDLLLSDQDGRSSNEQVAVLRANLHVGAKWVCREGLAGAEKPVGVSSVAVASSANKIQSPDALFTPGLEWSAYASSFGAPLREALGTATDCSYLPPGAKEAEPNNCVVKPNGNKLSFALTPTNVSSGRVTVTFKDKSGPARTVDFTIKSCAYSHTGPLPVLVPGAVRQVAKLTARETACVGRIPKGTRVRFSANNVEIPGVTEESGDREVTMLLTSIPANVKEGVYDWSLTDGGEVFGKVQWEVGAPVTPAAKKLGVRYEHPALDAAQSGESADEIAVVNLAGKPSGVLNTATLKLPNGLSALADSLGVKDVDNAWKREPNARPCKGNPVDQQGWLWLATGNNGVAIEGEESPLETAPGKVLPRATEVVFRATQRTSQPLSVSLSLRAARRCGPKKQAPDVAPQAPASDTPAAERPATASSAEEGLELDEVLLQVPVDVAKAAREESIPLPIAQAIEVVCYARSTWRDVETKDACKAPPDSAFDFALNGQLRAIEERAFENGQCWAVFDSSKFEFLESDRRAVTQHGPENLRRALTQYGTQALQVTVHRDNATDATVVWPLRPEPPQDFNVEDPKECAKEGKELWKQKQKGNTIWLPLPAPTGEPAADAPYVVTIRVAARPTSFAVYRTGSESTLARDEQLTAPELQFTARLRSRGTFGWRKPAWRTFFTVPVELTGLRFPAASVDLTSTSESEVVQIVQPRVGLLFGVEPWDYNKSTNLSPLPVRFLGGVHLFQFSEPVVAVSAVLGMSLTLPIFDKAPSQLGTNASIGLFWEVDLREVGGDFRFDRSSHFLVTAGFNVLSLLGSK